MKQLRAMWGSPFGYAAFQQVRGIQNIPSMFARPATRRSLIFSSSRPLYSQQLFIEDHLNLTIR